MIRTPSSWHVVEKMCFVRRRGDVRRGKERNRSQRFVDVRERYEETLEPELSNVFVRQRRATRHHSGTFQRELRQTVHYGAQVCGRRFETYSDQENCYVCALSQ